MTAVHAEPGTDVRGIDSSGEFRDLLLCFSVEDVEKHVFSRCDHTLVFSRHHWLRYKGDYRLRADLRAAVDDLRGRDPRTWDDEECELVLVLYVLSLAQVGLEQLKDVITLDELRATLEARLWSYLDALGQPRGTTGPLTIIEMAGRVTELRAQVENFYYRHSIIDGAAWHRAEGLIPKASVDLGTLTPPVEALLAGDYGLTAGPAEERLREATAIALRRDGCAAELIRGVMRAAVADPLLRVDHATVTCARGDMLDRVEQMTGSEAFFTDTVLRDGLDLADFAEQIGHDSVDRLRKTTRARMLKLKRGAVRNYFRPGCLQGQWVEKAADYMIFRNEDAHYRGHRSIGCSTGGRAAYTVRYENGGQLKELPPMMGDFRVVRLSHAEEDLFTAADLVHVIRYSQWIRAVLEETFRRGGIVEPPPPTRGAADRDDTEAMED
ncbi:hypothetical protein AB0C14_34575 [Microbispora hainanensis]|uniref:hypothetical protein n=1 Tax=Microbispora hainanensis TaxID=568844 RepID=UPI00340BE29A